MIWIGIILCWVAGVAVFGAVASIFMPMPDRVDVKKCQNLVMVSFEIK